jgi:hypothetical protein
VGAPSFDSLNPFRHQSLGRPGGTPPTIVIHDELSLSYTSTQQIEATQDTEPFAVANGFGQSTQAATIQSNRYRVVLTVLSAGIHWLPQMVLCIEWFRPRVECRVDPLFYGR